MSSIGLNKWIVSGHLAADAEIKPIDLKNGEKTNLARATIFVRKPGSRDESFTVSLKIWQSSSAWRRLPYLKKGSLIICTGSVEISPYLSKTDNRPRAGLTMNVLDIDLDKVRNAEAEDAAEEGGQTGAIAESPATTSIPQQQATQKSVAQTATPAATAKSPQATPTTTAKVATSAATTAKTTQARTAQTTAANSQTSATKSASRATLKVADNTEGTYNVEK
jgi:single-stranded DNA-binding protein